AVFIPLLFMAGLQGRLFREFAVTLSVAVLISLVLSLTTTPMMCAWLLQPGGADAKREGRLARVARRGYDWMLARYEQSLDWALASKAVVMLIFLAVIALNAYLFIDVPIHAEGRKQRRPARMVTQADGRVETASGADRHRHRSAGERRRDQRQGRSHRGRAPRHPRERRRCVAVQRVRPAAGGDDLHR